MKTYKEFMQESSLSRIKSKSDKSGIATLSADRGNKSRKENQARSKQLQKDIRGKFGRGPTKLKGSYDEKDEKTGESRKVKEKTLVGLNHKVKTHTVNLKLKEKLSHTANDRKTLR